MSIAWIHVRCMCQVIHTKEEKFSWMEMGIVVKIHVPIQAVPFIISVLDEEDRDC